MSAGGAGFTGNSFAGAMIPATLTKGARWMNSNRCDHARPAAGCAAGPAVPADAAGTPAPLTDGPAPVPAGRENRVHLRAYKRWADLLGGRRSPAVADLSGGTMLDIGAHCLLLDFSAGTGDPAVIYMGERLARTFDSAAKTLGRALSSVSGGAITPAGGSPLHGLDALYRRVLATAGPAGFERETRSPGGPVLLCRGIVLPFCGDGVRVDHVLVVVNWKERALEADEAAPAAMPAARAALPAAMAAQGAPPTAWADGPGCDADRDSAAAPLDSDASRIEDALPCALPPALAQALRALPPLPLAALAPVGEEFALALVRRCDGGPVHLLAEVQHDPVLLVAAARRLAP